VIENAPVAIILVNYNQGRFIYESWLSIQEQTISPVQVFIVDDGSMESDIEIINKLLKSASSSSYQPAFIHDEKNLGISSRLNQVLSEVKTEWLLVLAADDYLLPNALENLIQNANDSVDVVWGNLDVMNEEGELSGFSRPKDTWQGAILNKYRDAGKPFNDLLRFNNFIPGGMTLIRTSTVREAGGWDPTITTEDLDLWLRISSNSDFKYIDESVGKYRIVRGSKSRMDSHKLRDHAVLLAKHSGSSKEIDKGIAYLAAMRWAFTVLRLRRIPDYSIKEMSKVMGVSSTKTWLQMPRAIATPLFWAMLARVKRLTKW
jgi:GT2 family glycosyltransferase